MSNNRISIKSQKKKVKRRRIFTWVIMPFLVLTLTATAYGAFLYNKAESVMDESYKPIERKSSKRDKEVDMHSDNFSVLFAGVDDSESRNYNEGARTDALMVATFNERAKSVKLLSIPRDSLVYIPNKGEKDKINHSYGNGGIESTIESVEELLDIPIDRYVKMNFEGFIDIIDALDGIEAEVPYALSEKDSKDRHNAINLQPGLQTLNGEEALALARTRKKDTDMARGMRQQEILKAIIDKAASTSAITKYPEVIQAVGDNMSTDMSFNQMKAFLGYATAGTGINIEAKSLKGEAKRLEDGIWYYVVDDLALSQLRIELQTHLQLTESELNALGTEQNDMENSSNY
jgi:LCP family protein required for cell wall assembly